MKVRVYQSTRTGNISFFDVYENPVIIVFETSQDLFDFVKKTKCRVKRFAGPQFGDDNGRYTDRMAFNDFNKYAK